MYDDYDDAKDNILRDIKKKADKIEEGSNRGKNEPGGEIGICRTCQWCHGYERELGNVYYKCDMYDRIFNLSKPKIIKCSSWKGKEKIFLAEMYAMAWLIDNNDKTIKGFGQE